MRPAWHHSGRACQFARELSLSPPRGRDIEQRYPAAPYDFKARFRTFFVIWEVNSSTRSDAGQVMEPTEKTDPPEGVSYCTISAPPSSGLRPLASKRALTGDDGLILSVS